jgi:hypothetical protein
MAFIEKRGPNLSPEIVDVDLDIPDAPPYPEKFYREVARVYSRLSKYTHRPAEELAQAHDVPVRRVHGWIKEARQRGYLGAGRRGKVS